MFRALFALILCFSAFRGHADVTPTERYVRAAFDAGLPRDQLENFLRARIVFQPRQLAASAAARLCDSPNGPTDLGYGGARGGGKSYWGLGQIFCDDCARVPELKFLYLRKVGKAGKEAVHDLRRQVLHSTPHEYKEGLLIRRDNGSRVVLGHFQHEKDIDNYLGLEYDGALIEEATQLTTRKIRDISTCVRSSKPPEIWRPRKYFTTNPGNLGHAWFKAKFVVPWRQKTETSTRFIPATVYDNSFVNPEYKATLEELTGWQRRAWLDGDWDIAAGQYFTTWVNDVHVRGDIKAQPHWRYWLALDYGFAHYTVVYLMAQDGDGNVYVIDEHAERGWLPDAHATDIFAMLARHRVQIEQIESIEAGGDVFNRGRDGQTIADDYEKCGLTLSRANMNRRDGAAELLRRLGDPNREPPKQPTLFISDRCTKLIECIPSLMHDEHRSEDVKKVDCDDDGFGGDDPYDACRYGLMYVADGPTAFSVDQYLRA